MKIRYEVGDKVIITDASGLYSLCIGDIVKVVDVDETAFVEHCSPYQVRNENGEDNWVDDFNISPVTVPFLTQMNETEITEYREKMLEEYRDKMLEDDNKKCLEFLAKNSSEYFTPEEIAKNANISFTSLKTLERTLMHQSDFPYWKQEELGYKVMYKLKPNKKKYYGDDGSVLFRGKSERYFCAVEVKEICDYDEEEECEEDE